MHVFLVSVGTSPSLLWTGSCRLWKLFAGRPSAGTVAEALGLYMRYLPCCPGSGHCQGVSEPSLRLTKPHKGLPWAEGTLGVIGMPGAGPGRDSEGHTCCFFSGPERRLPGEADCLRVEELLGTVGTSLMSV